MNMYTDKHGTMSAFRVGFIVRSDGIVMSCHASLAHTAQAHTLIMAVNIRPIWDHTI